MFQKSKNDSQTFHWGGLTASDIWIHTWRRRAFSSTVFMKVRPPFFFSFFSRNYYQYGLLLFYNGRGLNAWSASPAAASSFCFGLADLGTSGFICFAKRRQISESVFSIEYKRATKKKTIVIGSLALRSLGYALTCDCKPSNDFNEHIL